MRPIVSNIDAPTYKLSKWLVQNFNTLPKGLYVRNSFDFVERIKHVRLEPDVVSFDVDSLYPNVPTTEALVEISEWLSESFTEEEESKVLFEATEICMSKNQFMYDNRFFKLSEGTNMENPLSCFVANIFMCRLEMDLKSENLFPRIWWRFVDDVFAIIKKRNLDSVLSLLNSTKYKTIRFTTEVEENSKISFLDLSLKRQTDGTIGISVFRKATSLLPAIHIARHHIK